MKLKTADRVLALDDFLKIATFSPTCAVTVRVNEDMFQALKQLGRGSAAKALDIILARLTEPIMELAGAQKPGPIVKRGRGRPRRKE